MYSVSGSGTGFPFDLIKTLTLQTEYPDKLMIQRMRKQNKKNTSKKGDNQRRCYK